MDGEGGNNKIVENEPLAKEAEEQLSIRSPPGGSVDTLLTPDSLESFSPAGTPQSPGPSSPFLAGRPHGSSGGGSANGSAIVGPRRSSGMRMWQGQLGGGRRTSRSPNSSRSPSPSSGQQLAVPVTTAAATPARKNETLPRASNMSRMRAPAAVNSSGQNQQRRSYGGIVSLPGSSGQKNSGVGGGGKYPSSAPNTPRHSRNDLRQVGSSPNSPGPSRSSSPSSFNVLNTPENRRRSAHYPASAAGGSGETRAAAPMRTFSEKNLHKTKQAPRNNMAAGAGGYSPSNTSGIRALSQSHLTSSHSTFTAAAGASGSHSITVSGRSNLKPRQGQATNSRSQSQIAAHAAAATKSSLPSSQLKTPSVPVASAAARSQPHQYHHQQSPSQSKLSPSQGSLPVPSSQGIIPSPSVKMSPLHPPSSLSSTSSPHLPPKKSVMSPRMPAKTAAGSSGQHGNSSGGGVGGSMPARPSLAGAGTLGSPAASRLRPPGKGGFGFVSQK